MSIKNEATIEDLYQVPENSEAEIVNEKLVLMSPTGFRHGRTGGEIYASLRDYERRTKSGYTLPDNVGLLLISRTATPSALMQSSIRGNLQVGSS